MLPSGIASPARTRAIESPSPAAVLFDFDFTLADSTKGCIDCIEHALRRLSLPQPPHARMRETIGLSLPAGLAHLTGIVDGEMAEAYTRHFVARADEVMTESTFILEGVPEVLARLSGLGLKLAVVSTKYRYRIEQILEREGLLDYFAVIVGGEDTTRHKPDPAALLLALERLGQEAEEVVYVGDHVVDAEAAAAAGIPFVAVLTGTSPVEHFASHSPVAILEDLAALPGLAGCQTWARPMPGQAR